ncbi:MAG: hypothetical protein Q9218_005627 [Villophora microphyllina]
MAFIKSSLILLSISLGHLASCTPLVKSPEALAARDLSTCQVVSDIVNILHNPALSASATKFCSSFISIPLETATNVATTTITPLPVTATATITASATTVVTTTLGLPLTTAPATLGKRNPTLPPYLSAFASSKVSAACSCLSIQPATTTVAGQTTVTASASIATATITVTSTTTSTSTVLGVASQCLPAAITASPARLFHPGQVAIAGTAQEVGSSFPINNVQDCCSACYLATSNCVAFTYGNVDNEGYPFVLDNPSTVNTCRIYRDVFGNCANDVSIFTSPRGSLPGEVNNFGVGPCTPEDGAL